MTNSIMEVIGCRCHSDYRFQHSRRTSCPCCSESDKRSEAGAKLIVIDPRRVPLAKNAEVFLQVKPGTNVAALNGMMNVILEEGLADDAYIAAKNRRHRLS
jgi:anaerobic selenocysteine-containing dehydrogenase